MGLYSITQDRRGHASSPTRPTAPGPRSSTTRGCALADDLDIAPDGRIFFTEVDHPLRHARMGGRLAREPRQRPHHLLRPARPARRTTILDSYRFPNGVCIAHDGQSLSCSPRPGPAASAATGSTGRRRAQVEMRDRGPAGLSRQHQPRLRRQLLAGAGRHAHAVASTWRCTCPASASAWPRRMPPDEWLFPNINTGCVVKFDESGDDHRDPVGSRRREPPDDHLDARAQGLPLCRRHPQQPHRPLPLPGADPELDRRRHPTGERSDDRRDPHVLDSLLGRGERRSPCRRWTARCGPTRRLDEAAIVAMRSPTSDNLLPSTAAGRCSSQRRRRSRSLARTASLTTRRVLRAARSPALAARRRRRARGRASTAARSSSTAAV